jgi:hypothetical protein
MPGQAKIRAVVGLAMLIAASLACNAQFGGSAPTAVAQESSVVFIAPQNGSLIAEGSDITLAVNTNDPGAAKVEFRIDDNVIGTQTAPTGSPQGSFTARQPWKATGIQGHLVEAVASRADGTQIGAAKITLEVVAPPTQAATEAATQLTTQAASASPTRPPASATTAPSPTQAASNTPSAPTAPDTSGQPTLQVTAPNLNIRAGPGTNFPIIDAMKTGDSAIIVGRNAAKSWWVIQKGQTRGWCISDTAYSQVVGDASNVPVVASPPTPVPSAAPTTNPPPAAPTSTTGPVADLVIDSVTLNPGTPTANQTFNVSVVVRNQGTVDAGTSLLVGVFQPGNETSPVAVPAINAGQSVTVSMPVTLHSSGANQTATITVDSQNEINEGPNGEANNVKTITYNVN